MRFFELADTTLGDFLVDKNNNSSLETSISILAQVTMAVFTLHTVGNKTHNDIHHNNIMLMKTDKKSGMYWHYRVPAISFTLTANKYKKTITYTDLFIQNCGWLALLADFGEMGTYNTDGISSDFQSVFSSVFVYANESYLSIENCLDYLREVRNPAVLFEKPDGKVINDKPFTLDSTEYTLM